MSDRDSLSKEQSDTTRLNWWFMNVILNNPEDDESSWELEGEASCCRTPDEFRNMIDRHMVGNK